MNSLTGLPQSGVILLTTFAFAGLAWTTNTPRAPEERCEHLAVIQYLPLPEPTPIFPHVQEVGWPVLKRQRADDAEPVVAKEEADAEPAPAPRRRQWRHHWRRR